MTNLNRRRFLGLLGTGAMGTVLVACGSGDEVTITATEQDQAASTLAPLSGTPLPPPTPTPAPTEPPSSPEASGGGESTPAGNENAQQGGGGGGGGSAELKAVGSIAFDKKELTMSPGGTLSFENTTPLEHDVVIEELDDLALIPLTPGGETAKGTLPDDTKPGTYTYYCSVTGHRAAGMEGKLTVQ